MKKIKILILIFIGISLSSFLTMYKQGKNNYEIPPTKENDYPTYETYNYLPEEVYNQIEVKDDYCLSTICLASKPDLSVIEKEADVIAVVSIISLDGGDMNLAFAIGATYGRLIINNVLKGKLNNGDIVEYIKAGGIFTEYEWNQAQPSTSKEKRKQAQEQAGIYEDELQKSKNTYYPFHYPYDPLAEEGKVYLAYLKYNENLNKYEIIGSYLGFRELKIEKSNTVSSKPLILEEYQIKINETNEYEDFSKYFLIARGHIS